MKEKCKGKCEYATIRVIANLEHSSRNEFAGKERTEIVIKCVHCVHLKEENAKRNN